MASDASMIIRTQLVQAVKKTPQDNTFKLRLHEEIRLNDNDSIKTAGERFKEKKREIARRRKLGLPLLEESDTEGCGSSTAS